MNKVKHISLLLALLMSGNAFGQAEMADSFRAEGKIYVVVAIILIILVGVFIYLFTLDRKVKKLEDRFPDKH
jgi:CcmD family protein